MEGEKQRGEENVSEVAIVLLNKCVVFLSFTCNFISYFSTQISASLSLLPLLLLIFLLLIPLLFFLTCSFHFVLFSSFSLLSLTLIPSPTFSRLSYVSLSLPSNLLLFYHFFFLFYFFSPSLTFTPSLLPRSCHFLSFFAA